MPAARPPASNTPGAAPAPTEPATAPAASTSPSAAEAASSFKNQVNARNPGAKWLNLSKGEGAILPVDQSAGPNLQRRAQTNAFFNMQPQQGNVTMAQRGGTGVETLTPRTQSSNMPFAEGTGSPSTGMTDFSDWMKTTYGDTSKMTDPSNMISTGVDMKTPKPNV